MGKGVRNTRGVVVFKLQSKKAWGSMDAVWVLALSVYVKAHETHHSVGRKTDIPKQEC